jgi:HEAT repeat protein
MGFLGKLFGKGKESPNKVTVPEMSGTELSEEVKKLIADLKDEDKNVRRKAAQFLARTKDARVVEPLIVAVIDPDPDVSSQAAYSLGLIGTPAVEPLIAALKHQDQHVRKAAINALGRIGDVRAAKPLIKALRDSDSSVRQEVPMALGNIGANAKMRRNIEVTSQLIETLIITLKGKDASVCNESAMALELLTGKNFGKNVNQWKEWWKTARGIS